MNIGIDITPIIYDRGISRYTANLVRALARKNGVNLSLFASTLRQKLVLDEFVKTLKPQQSWQGKNTIEYVCQQYPVSIQTFLWNTLHQNKIKNIFPKVDVFHSWDWLQPPDKNLPLVSTIHDLAILKFPEIAHPKIVKMHQQSWKILRERQAEIIAVSHATRKDVIELLGFAPEKVHVIHEALPEEAIQETDDLDEEAAENVKAKYQLKRPYILFVGTREPRKNLFRLIEAWQPLSKEFDLVIVGEKGWDGVEESQYANMPGLRLLGKVSNVELSILYGEAELFVYPSLYEGFGLPILEAFHHGTPVVTSAVSSMPEVAGNAAELVDPFSVESIRKGMKTILDEDHEAQQKRLQRMIIRLHLFNWDHVAEETLKVYQRAVQLHVQ